VLVALPLSESNQVAQGAAPGDTSSVSLDRTVYPVPFGVPDDFATDLINTIPAG